MSVLIKGMEMPKTCEWCSFISTFTTESGLGCRCEVKKFEFWDYSKRQENCPLVEVPTPHGRLIDADRLIKVLQDTLDNHPNNYNDGRIIEKLIVDACKQFVEHCPATIEAEV